MCIYIPVFGLLGGISARTEKINCTRSLKVKGPYLHHHHHCKPELPVTFESPGALLLLLFLLPQRREAAGGRPTVGGAE